MRQTLHLGASTGTPEEPKKFPKIKFTVYTYDGTSVAGAKAGFHINPVDGNENTRIAKINSNCGRGMPVSIHGRAGNSLSARVMSALKNKSVPFIRSAYPDGAVAGTPPVKASFGGTNTIASIQGNPSIGHYFTHPNSESSPGMPADTTLTYFNKYAR